MANRIPPAGRKIWKMISGCGRSATSRALWKIVVFAAAIISSANANNPELVIRRGHSDVVRSVAFSSNGRLLLSGSSDNSIIVWDVKTAREIRTMRGHKNVVRSVVFSPDQKSVLSASYDGTLKLWKLIDGALIRTFQGHTSNVNAAVFSPDGKFIASASADKSVIIWNAATGSVIHTFIEHKAEVLTVSISPDGNHVASGGRDNTVYLWNAKTGEVEKEMDEHSSAVYSVTFSNDGKRLLSSSNDKSIILWDLEDEEVLMTLTGHADIVCDAVFSTDEKFVISASGDRTVKVWDLQDGTVRHTMTGHAGWVSSIDVNPAGRFVVTGSDDHTLKLWDIHSGREQKTFMGKPVSVNAVAISPDERIAVVACSDNSVRLWNLTRGKIERSFYGHTNQVTAVAFLPDGQHFVSAGLDKMVFLWKVTQEPEVKSIKWYSPLYALNTFEKGGHIIAGFDDGAFLWDPVKDTVIQTFRRHVGNVYSIANSKDEKFILTGSYDKTMKLWDVETGKALRTFEGHTEKVLSVALSSDDKLALSGSEDNSVRLWDVETGRALKTFKGHTNSVTKVEFLPGSPDRIISSSGGVASNEHVVNVWDIASGKIIRSYTGSVSEIKNVDVTRDGSIAVIVTSGGTIHLWEPMTGKEIALMYSPGEKESFVTMLPNGYFFGSKSALKDLHNVNGIDIHTFEQFDLQYNRPDKVIEQLHRSSTDVILSYRKAYEKRLRKMVFDPNSFDSLRTFHVPQVTVEGSDGLYMSTTDPYFELKIQAEDSDVSLNRVFISINGVPLDGVRGFTIPSSDKKQFKQTRKVELTEGVNRINVSVMNSKGAESPKERIEIEYRPAKSLKNNLHVIAIGISSFRNSDYNLSYADKDALDFIQMMQSQQSRYNKIIVHPFINEQATRAGILQVKETLRNTDVGDVVMVFVASHGLLDAELEYYIAMHNVDFTNPREGGLRYDELENLLDGISARKTMMLIDACHSGEVDKEELEIASESIQKEEKIKTRGFKKIKSKSSSIGLSNSFDLMKELFTDLRRNNGAVVISSASGKEYALESGEWKNGVFTYSILEGLKNRKCDLNNDQQVTVSELRDYVSKQVQELTNGKQNPTSRTENLENDFRIW